MFKLKFSLDVMYVLYFLRFSLDTNLLVVHWGTPEFRFSNIWLDIVEIILLTAMGRSQTHMIWIVSQSPSVDLLGCQFSLVYNLILEPISWFMACPRCHMVLSHKCENLFLSWIWMVSQVCRLVHYVIWSCARYHKLNCLKSHKW